MSNKVVIVGAGYAGIEAALTLNKYKKKDKKEKIEVTIIDKNPYHTLLTELHEVAGNRVSEEAVRIPLSEIFKFTDVKVVYDEIEAFDFNNNKVSSTNKEYEYDYLIMAMGSTPNFFGIPGLKENAFTLWSYEDAIRIREHIKKCFRLAVHEEDKQERIKLLTFVVGGAGFTGVEMAGELAHWTKGLAREHGIDYKEVRLLLVDMLPHILNCLSEKNSKKAHDYMEKKLGIEIMLNTPVKEVTSEGISTGNAFINTKTLIWAAGITACEATADMDVEKVGRSRRLKVDEFCRTNHENVYAVGDISNLVDENGVPYPAMVENAIQTAEGAAKNIIRSIKGKELEKVTVKMHGTMVSVGNYFTVSEIMGKILPVWLSIIMKYMVNIHYLWEITGFRGVGRYLYHEVLERRHRKLFLEKHWSTRMQAWWLTLLRVFLGVIWLYEGIKKVSEGWLSSPKLASFLGMAADATSTPTGAGIFVKRIDELFNLDLVVFHFMLGKESRLVEGNIIASDLFAKLEILHIGSFNPIPWILRNIVLANGTVAMIFQVLVVILEILVGLMLIGGAFTFIASLISFGLMMMFITSTGIYEKTWWMIFASIAAMGGAGRAFGLDYYLIPYIVNVWDYFWKNRKLRLLFSGGLERFE
ncbi:MAG TPA: NAD(P)/FAD-dependent oxidoreductase [Clostridiales bacterium]|nr:NAD(P)/FAD-dependent oxidoreductase [Clostridiales bacterium]